MTARASRRLLLGGGLVATLVAAGLVPPPAEPTLAAWTDGEWAHGPLSTASAQCGVDEGYESEATARFLRGSLAGTDLDDVAAARGLDLAQEADGTVAVAPSTALPVGSTPGRSTFVDPLSVDALGSLVDLDLTGLALGLPAGSAGAVGQYAQVTGTGDVTAASGLVSDSGGVLVGADAPDDQLPEPARLDLARLLPGQTGGTTGVDAVGLEVGAVGSSAELDGCAALRSAVWGDGSVSGVTRDYGVARLGLVLDSPLVAGLAGTVSATATATDTAVTGLTGREGLISRAVQDGVLAVANGVVGLLGLGGASGSVSLTPPRLAAVVDPLLGDVLTSDDGTVTVDLASGRVAVDLAALLGDEADGLNELPPNTELVLDGAALDSVTATVGALLDGWTAAVLDLLRSTVEAARLDVALRVDLRLGAVNVLKVDVTLAGTVAEVLAGTATARIGTEVLTPTLNLLLGGLLNPLLSALLGGAGTVLSTVGAVLQSVLLGPLEGLGRTVTTAVGGLVTTVGSVVARLPSILSLRVNVRPDEPGLPGGPVPPVADGSATPAYEVTALRIGLLDGLGTLAALDLATSRVGPVRLPPPPG